MRDYALLAKSFRHCAEKRECASCPMYVKERKCPDFEVRKLAADAIEELLSAVPKRGEWITTRTWEHDGEPYCSICGFEQSFTRFQKFKYCPMCGRRLEVE